MKESQDLHINLHQTRIFKILTLVLLCVAFFLFHIWFRTVVTHEGYALGILGREMKKTESQLMALKVEKNKIMGASSLERLVDKHEDVLADEKFQAPAVHQLYYIQQK